MGNIPADIIVYAFIAAGLLLWLRGVLGTRHGSERQRPNPFTLPAEGEKPASGAPAAASERAALPGAAPSVDAAMVQISLADRSFEAPRFVENAREAFVMVVTAFADGDRETLRDLLTPDVYKSFEAEIKRREDAGQKAITEVLSVRDVTVIAAKLEGNQASITVRIKADETYALSDRDGKTIAGNPERVVAMTDVWTYTRDVKSSDPRWFVCETRDDVKEDDARNLPEAGSAAGSDTGTVH